MIETYRQFRADHRGHRVSTIVIAGQPGTYAVCWTCPPVNVGPGRTGPQPTCRVTVVHPAWTEEDRETEEAEAAADLARARSYAAAVAETPMPEDVPEHTPEQIRRSARQIPLLDAILVGTILDTANLVLQGQQDPDTAPLAIYDTAIAAGRDDLADAAAEMDSEDLGDTSTAAETWVALVNLADRYRHDVFDGRYAAR
jgi:hypothetical protein